VEVTQTLVETFLHKISSWQKFL